MLTRERIVELFQLLNARLGAEGVVGEIHLVGGAVRQADGRWLIINVLWENRR